MSCGLVNTHPGALPERMLTFPVIPVFVGTNFTEKLHMFTLIPVVFRCFSLLGHAIGYSNGIPLDPMLKPIGPVLKGARDRPPRQLDPFLG